jgi:KilA-N domain
MYIVPREWSGRTIRQREDGYFSATDMCQACGKRWSNWERLDSTKEYLEALQNKNYSDLSNSGLIDSRVGNLGEESGTWVYRKVAIRLAQWLSPEFAIQVDEWVEELLTTGKAEVAPQHPKDELTQIKAEMDLLSFGLTIAGLSPELISGITLNHAASRVPSLASAVNEAHKILAATTTSPVLLTPTTIGKELGISAIAVNQILTEMGCQTKNSCAKKGEPKYLVTEAGKGYAANTIATGLLGDNSSYQHLKWSAEIIQLIKEYIDA